MQLPAARPSPGRLVHLLGLVWFCFVLFCFGRQVLSTCMPGRSAMGVIATPSPPLTPSPSNNPWWGPRRHAPAPRILSKTTLRAPCCLRIPQRERLLSSVPTAKRCWLTPSSIASFPSPFTSPLPSFSWGRLPSQLFARETLTALSQKQTPDEAGDLLRFPRTCVPRAGFVPSSGRSVGTCC